LGTTLLAGAVAATANSLVQNAGKVAADERKKILLLYNPNHRKGSSASLTSAKQSSSQPEEPIMTEEEQKKEKEEKRIENDNFQHYYWKYLLYKFLNYINWFPNHSKYLAILLLSSWTAVGVAFGVFYEGWTFAYSLKWTLAAVSASAIFPPTCPPTSGGTCDLGTVRSLLVGTYIIVGVPIFAFTMGQFAYFLVENAIRINEQQLMLRPLTADEFKFAFELQKGHVISQVDDEDDDDLLLEEEDLLLMEGDTPYGVNYGGDEEAGVGEADEVETMISSSQGGDYHGAATPSVAPSEELAAYPFRRQSSSNLQHPNKRGSNRGRTKRSFSTISITASSIDDVEKRKELLQQRKRRNSLLKRQKSFRKASTKQEFQLDLGYFIILELLRVQKITKDDLLSIKCLFDQLDEDKDGRLTKVRSKPSVTKLPLTPSASPKPLSDKIKDRTTDRSYAEHIAGAALEPITEEKEDEEIRRSIEEYNQLKSLQQMKSNYQDRLEPIQEEDKSSVAASIDSHPSLHQLLNRKSSDFSERRRSRGLSFPLEAVAEDIRLKEELEKEQPSTLNLPKQADENQPKDILEAAIIEYEKEVAEGKAERNYEKEREKAAEEELEEEGLDEEEEEWEEGDEEEGEEEDEEEGEDPHNILAEQYNQRIVNMMHRFVKKFQTKKKPHHHHHHHRSHKNHSLHHTPKEVSNVPNNSPIQSPRSPGSPCTESYDASPIDKHHDHEKEDANDKLTQASGRTRNIFFDFISSLTQPLTGGGSSHHHHHHHDEEDEDQRQLLYEDYGSTNHDRGERKRKEDSKEKMLDEEGEDDDDIEKNLRNLRIKIPSATIPNPSPSISSLPASRRRASSYSLSFARPSPDPDLTVHRTASKRGSTPTHTLWPTVKEVRNLRKNSSNTIRKIGSSNDENPNYLSLSDLNKTHQSPLNPQLLSKDTSAFITNQSVRSSTGSQRDEFLSNSIKKASSVDPNENHPQHHASERTPLLGKKT
jgi:hypothetical protein